MDGNRRDEEENTKGRLGDENENQAQGREGEPPINRVNSPASNTTSGSSGQKRLLDDFELDELLNMPYHNTARSPPKKRRKPPPPPIISKGGEAALAKRLNNNGNSVEKSPEPSTSTSSSSNKTRIVIPLPPIYQTPPLTGNSINSLKEIPSSRKTRSRTKEFLAKATATVRDFFANREGGQQNLELLPSSIARIDFSSIYFHADVRPLSLLSLAQYDSDDSASSSRKNTNNSNHLSVNTNLPIQQTSRPGAEEAGPSIALSSSLTLGTTASFEPTPTTPPISSVVDGKGGERNAVLTLQDQVSMPVKTINSAEEINVPPPPAKSFTSTTINNSSTSAQTPASRVTSVQQSSLSNTANGDPMPSTSSFQQSNLSNPMEVSIVVSKQASSTAAADKSTSIVTAPSTATSAGDSVASSSTTNVVQNQNEGLNEAGANSSRKAYSKVANTSTTLDTDEIDVKPTIEPYFNTQHFYLKNVDFPPLLATVNDATMSENSGVSYNFNQDLKNWREGLGIDERFNYLRNITGESGGRNHDVIFEVGPEKQVFYAHLLMLSTVSSTFRSQSKSKIKSGNQEKPCKFHLPNVSPAGFQDMLEFMYTGKFEASDVTQAYSLLEAARSIEYGELENFCMDFLKSSVSADNTPDYYHLGLTRNEELLKEMAVEYLKRNTWEVFASERFINLSEEVIKSLLNNDDFFLDERHIFEAVKKWAKAKHQRKQNAELDGAKLREELGSILYCIRFPTMSLKDFFKIDKDNRGLLTDTEVAGISRYLSLKDDDGSDLCLAPQPLNFNCVPRIKKESSDPASRKDNRSRPLNYSCELESIKQEKIEEFTFDNNVEAVGNPSSVSTAHEDAEIIDVDSDDDDQQTSKENNEVRSDNTNDKRYVQGLQSLSEFTQQLLFDENVEMLSKISKELLLTKNPIRIYLPHLKEFRLKLFPKIQKQHGTAFKSFWKGKSSKLNEFLFFDKVREGGDEQETNPDSNYVLEHFLSHRVNITITVPQPQVDALTSTSADVMMLKVDHDEGIIIIHLIKDAQKIINGAGGFPLKVLAVSDCELANLNPVNKDALEVVVIRRVKGLKNRGEFLRQCTNLREVCWNDMDKECIDLHYSLWRTSPHIRKISFSKCKIDMAQVQVPQENFIEELYLDNCIWKQEFVDSLPTLFPFVKRVLMYGVKNDSTLFQKLLEIPNIEWIMVWSLTYKYTKLNTKTKGRYTKKVSVMTPDSRRIQGFLRGIFGERATNQEVTFVIERKPESRINVPGTSNARNAWNPLDSSNWKGEMFTVKDSFEKISQIDFVHNRYDIFYPTYEVFRLADMTAKDYKNQMQKKILPAAKAFC